MKKPVHYMLASALTLLITPCQWAQDETPVPTQDQGITSAGQEPTSTPTVIPDTRPLSGAEDLRVETAGRSRNYAIPSLRVSTFGDTSRTILATGGQGIELTGSIAGSLEVHRASRKSDFAMDYRGGGQFYAHNPELNGVMQQLAISERYTGRRWGITLGDQMSYLPESAYGFGGFGPSVGLGGAAGGWNPIYIPDQTIFSGGGDRVFNTALVQVEYLASARSVLSISGAYGVLRFREPGLVENNSLHLSAGYNYAVTRRDTFSMNYAFGAIRFIGSDFQLDNHAVSLAYGRLVTGKLKFSISGGPQIIIRRLPVLGEQSSPDFFARVTMNYRMGRNNLNWEYTHYTSNGSGVFLGAKTDRFHGGFTRRLTRNWSWTMGSGYSRNTRLKNGLGVTDDYLYHSIFGNSSLSRDLGRYTTIAFSYNIYRQWSNTTSTSGTIRSSSYLRHFFGVSLTWHGSRIGLD